MSARARMCLLGIAVFLPRFCFFNVTSRGVQELRSMLVPSTTAMYGAGHPHMRKRCARRGRKDEIMLLDHIADYAVGEQTSKLSEEVLHHAQRAVIDWHAALLPGSIVA